MSIPSDSPSAKKPRFAASDEYELPQCPMCFMFYSIFYRRITTQCGHNICESCVEKMALMSVYRCPLCLHVEPKLFGGHIVYNGKPLQGSPTFQSIANGAANFSHTASTVINGFSTNSWLSAGYQHPKDVEYPGFLTPSFQVANDNGVRFIPKDDGYCLNLVRQLCGNSVNVKHDVEAKATSNDIHIETEESSF